MSFVTSMPDILPMRKIVNGGVSIDVQPGEILWGFRYEISRSGYRLNGHVIPREVIVQTNGYVTDYKGVTIHNLLLFTTESLCWDSYREAVANHLEILSYSVKSIVRVAEKVISRCPSVVTTTKHKELVETLHSSANSIK